MRAAAAGCDATLHAAAVYSLDPRRGGEVTRVNAAAAETVLRAAAEAGHDPVVHVSSYVALLPRTSAAPLDGDAPVGAVTFPYAGSKAASEIVARGLQAEGAPVAITYPGMVWGPDDPHLGETSRLAMAALAGRLPALPPGIAPISDVRDVAAVHAALMAPGRGGRRDVASGENLPIVEIVRTAVRVTGRRLPVVAVPAGAAAVAGRLGQALGRIGLDLLPAREATWLGSQAGPADPSGSDPRPGGRVPPRRGLDPRHGPLAPRRWAPQRPPRGRAGSAGLSPAGGADRPPLERPLDGARDLGDVLAAQVGVHRQRERGARALLRHGEVALGVPQPARRPAAGASGCRSRPRCPRRPRRARRAPRRGAGGAP